MCARNSGPACSSSGLPTCTRTCADCHCEPQLTGSARGACCLLVAQHTALYALRPHHCRRATLSIALHWLLPSALTRIAVADSALCCRGNNLKGGKIKEVHYFDAWPLPDFERWKAMYPANVSANATLVDATASYLYHSWAAARVQRLVPHARFVVLLRVRPWHCAPRHARAGKAGAVRKAHGWAVCQRVIAQHLCFVAPSAACCQC